MSLQLTRLSQIAENLSQLNLQNNFARRRPVTSHVLYAGAQLVSAERFAKIEVVAKEVWKAEVKSPSVLVKNLPLTTKQASFIFEAVSKRLAKRCVEDFRIDFEDGYGVRTEAEEDEHARTSGAAVRDALRLATLPPASGLRVKSLSSASLSRVVRTLQLFFDELLSGKGRRVPVGFVVTLPKIVSTAQVKAISDLLELIEKDKGLAIGTLGLELMVETAEALLNDRGCCPLPDWIAASAGRCVALHLGAYDLMSDCGIPATAQSLSHPLCDRARQELSLVGARYGVDVVDGATVNLPLGIHKKPKSALQKKQNAASVWGSWRESFTHISRALEQGIYSGWDLHPAQIPIRYVALYHYFTLAFPVMSERLKNFRAEQQKASRVGARFDDAATIRGITQFFDRGQALGVWDEGFLKRNGI